MMEFSKLKFPKPTWNLAIDTCHYLDIFCFDKGKFDAYKDGTLISAKQVLENNKPLMDRIKKGRIKLFLPEQVSDELKYKKPKVIRQFVTRVTKIQGETLKADNPTASLKKNKGELEQIWDAIGESHERFRIIYNKLLAEKSERDFGVNIFFEQLIKKLNIKIKYNSLTLSPLIKVLNKHGKKLRTTAKIRRSAAVRFEEKKFPKDKEDAIVWETLLQKCPDRENLYFISPDSHYKNPQSSKNNPDLNSALISDWKFLKKSNIIYYTRLGDFAPLAINHRLRIVDFLDEDIFFRGYCDQYIRVTDKRADDDWSYELEDGRKKHQKGKIKLSAPLEVRYARIESDNEVKYITEDEFNRLINK